MVRFTFLGGTRVERPDGPAVDVRGAQPALVLACLVLERPRPLRRDELVELLWPGQLPDHWEGDARQVLARARRALVSAGLPAASLTSADGVTVLDAGADVAVDVEVALGQVLRSEELAADGAWEDAARTAASAGDALRRPFLTTAESRWATSWHDRLEAFAQRAVYVTVSAAIATGRNRDAAAAARVARDRDPFDEEATRLLMKALEQAGDRPAALEAYERLRRRLDDELGVRPSDETEEMHRALLGAAPKAPVRPDDRVRSALPAADQHMFVGRKEEQGALAAAWQLAREGSCQLVVIEGEAGIGKTRLLLEEAHRARAADAVVLWGHCDPELGVAQGPFVDVIEQLLVERPGVLDRIGSAAAHLAPLVPDLSLDPGGAAPASSEQATARLFRAVGSALAAADGPMMLLLDDVHWADGDTLALLRHVVPRLAERRCLVVLTVREATPMVAGALAELQRLAPTTTLTLTGLSVDAVAELLGASDLDLAGGARNAAEVVTARTAGNPLYVTQLVREAEGSPLPFDPAAVPGAVARLLDRRLAALDRDLASLLVLAAVAGPVFELSTLETCAAVASGQVLDLVEELAQRRFLEERGPGRFGFAHELVREAVLQTVGDTRRTRTHERIGRALAAVDADPATVAHHFVEAGGSCVEDAVAWSLRAGRAAMGRAAWESAREHFGVAARLAPEPGARCEALIGLGRAQRALGAVADARHTLDDGLAVARAHGLDRSVASATLALVGGGGRGVALELADAERARLLHAARTGLSDDDTDLLVPVLAESALALVLTEAAGERRALCEECLAAARRWGDPNGIATALWARRTALMGPAGTETRARDGREALALPRSSLPPEAVLAAHLGRVEDLLELGDRAGADAALDAATRLAAELDHPYWSWATACWRTLVAIIDGRVDDAEQQAVAAAAGQSAGEHPEALAALGVNLVDVRLFQERSGEIVELVATAADENPHIPAYRAVLALCWAAAGDGESARKEYARFAACGFDLPDDSNWLLAMAVLADVAATLSDRDGAALLGTQLEPWADRQVVLNCYGGGGAYWGPVAHHLGRLAAARRDGDEARRLLTRAVELSEGFGAPRFVTRSQAALAALD